MLQIIAAAAVGAVVSTIVSKVIDKKFFAPDKIQVGDRVKVTGEPHGIMKVIALSVPGDESKLYIMVQGEENGMTFDYQVLRSNVVGKA